MLLYHATAVQVGQPVAMTATDIGEALGLSTTSASRSVGRLVQGGWLKLAYTAGSTASTRMPSAPRAPPPWRTRPRSSQPPEPPHPGAGDELLRRVIDTQIGPRRPGERVVARSDGKGGLILGVEKIRGREFAVSAVCKGYVLDARLLMDALGSLKMPGSWFQVWCKLTAAQNATRTDAEQRSAARGYVRITQRDLQSRCDLSAASVNEASQFFAHIGWMRTAKRGVLQLNPWLTVAGTSGEQESWQKEWNAAKGPVCVIPAPNYPTLWREERAKEKAAADAARRLETVVPLRRRRPPARKASA